MCGIFFYITHQDVILAQDKSGLEDTFQKLKHRGPDESRVRYYRANAMMGFHRLGIVDPTGDGMQPFEVSRYSCVINGEIYNYKELIANHKFEMRSNSDCEVVLHLFLKIVNGDTPKLHHMSELVKQLDGEFAIVIFDIETGITFAAVDEVRARPLFIGRHFIQSPYPIPYFTCLASEQKGLPAECYATPIMAGTCYAIFPDGEVKFEKYFTPPPAPAKIITRQESDFITVARNLKEVFFDNLKPKLHPEREYGFLLSGGLDSSLTAGAASYLLAPVRIRTFTGGFHAEASDILAARKVAKHINSIHTEYVFTYAEALAILPTVIYNNESYDQTTTRASLPMVLIMIRIKRDHPEMAVIYSGELADECFMGYLEWQSAPDAEEARDHVIRRVTDVSYFDGLRADRCVSAYSCELRLPFFGKRILDFIYNLPPEYLMPQHNQGIEKYLLRKAFEPNSGERCIIPEEILWRTKHAFSDATSLVGEQSLKEFLKRHAEREITDSRFACRKGLYPFNTPQTKEDMLYREIFASHGFAPKCIPYKWLPRWQSPDVTDASATVLPGFTETTHK